MTLTRRRFAQGSAALAAAAIVPTMPAAGQGAVQGTLKVRRSVGDLIREQSPLIESYRRGVDVMMKRDVIDKTSWWFQANIHDLTDDELAKLKSFERYWRQCPHKNYFFLSWHRAYLYFFERIVRKAAGDPDFTLPYWAYDGAGQATLPLPFTPDDDEMGKDPVRPALSRRNPLARANRLEHVDRRWIGLGNVATDLSAVMALDRFATDDKLDAQKAFGGVRSGGLLEAQVAGGFEAAPHNLVHKTIGLEGDLGAPETAAALVRAPRAAPLLAGYRGTEPVRLDALENLVLRVGKIAEDLPEVRSLRLDPVLASAEGAFVTGASVVLGPPPTRHDGGPRRMR